MLTQISDFQLIALRRKASKLSDKTLRSILYHYDHKPVDYLTGKLDPWYCVVCEEVERRKEFYYRQYLIFD